MMIPANICRITVQAQSYEEKENKSVNVNIEKTKTNDEKLTDDEIPDALIEAGEMRNEIKEKYKKRLYEEENNLNTLMFEEENGERTMYLFKNPVKYKDENGKITYKDISFKKIDKSYKSELKENYICDNGNNDIKINMPKDITDGIRITTENKVIEMSVKGEKDATTKADINKKANNTNETKNNKKYNNVTYSEREVIYNEVFGRKTKLKYTPTLNGIKEEIILQEYTGQTEYTFKMMVEYK